MKNFMFGLGLIALMACQGQQGSQAQSATKAVTNQRSVKVVRVTDPDNTRNLGTEFLLYISQQTDDTASLPVINQRVDAGTRNAIPIQCGERFSGSEKEFLFLLGIPSLPGFIPELSVYEAENVYSFDTRAPLTCGRNAGELMQTISHEGGSERKEYWLVERSPVTFLDQVYSLGCGELLHALGYKPEDAAIYEKSVFLDIYGQEVVDINCNFNSIGSSKKVYPGHLEGRGLLIHNEGPLARPGNPEFIPAVTYQEADGTYRTHRFACRNNPAALNHFIKGFSLAEKMEDLERINVNSPEAEKFNLFSQAIIHCPDDNGGIPMALFTKVDSMTGDASSQGYFLRDPAMDAGQKKLFFDIGCETAVTAFNLNPRSDSRGILATSELNKSRHNTIVKLGCGNIHSSPSPLPRID